MPLGTSAASQKRVESAAAPRRPGLARRLLFSEYLVLYLSIAYFAGILLFAPDYRESFASRENLRNVLSNMLPLLVAAIGQTVVLVTGGIDLSVTSTIALASVVGASVMSGDRGVLAGSPMAAPAGLAAMLGVGLLLGLLNGTVITRLRMPPFIVTLTMMMFFSGFAIWLTKSESLYNLPAGFNAIGGRLPFTLAVVVPLGLGTHVLLSRSMLGRWWYAVGHNVRAATVSGVPVERTIVLAYVACGLCAAVASVLYSGRLETGSPVMGQRILLDVVGAAVIGGTSLYGGKGKIAWTLFGVLFIALIDSSLNVLGRSHFEIMMIKGAVILLAALIDSARHVWLSR